MPRWLDRLKRWLAGKPLTLGARGERHAARYLRKQGMRIVTLNRRHGRGEIDIIAIDHEWLVFVEVRTRASEAYMSPEASIRHWKKKAVVATVRRLVRKYKPRGLKPRIDVIALIWPEDAAEPTSLRHHKAAIACEAW